MSIKAAKNYCEKNIFLNFCSLTRVTKRPYIQYACKLYEKLTLQRKYTDINYISYLHRSVINHTELYIEGGWEEFFLAVKRFHFIITYQKFYAIKQ